MLFSEFSPLGHFAFSGRQPRGQVIYESMRASLGENYSTDRNGLEMARLYAQAMGIASALYTLDRAVNNIIPTKATELLTELEREWGLVAGAVDTLPVRRAALAIRRLLPRGATREAIEDALTQLLGADFISYEPIAEVDRVTWGGDGIGSFVKANKTPRKLIRIVGAISTGLGSPQIVTYEAFVPGEPLPDLLPGETLVVDPAVLAEAVTVESRAGATFTATFDSPHDPGTPATTQPMPIWGSTGRVNIVTVTSAAAADARTREAIDDLMRRALRGVSTWHIADASGPFTVGVGKIGITPLGPFP